MSFQIKDLGGLGEPIKKLIEVISQGIGSISAPYLIRKNAEAKAYEIRTIAEAIKDQQEGLKEIKYEEGKLALISGNEKHSTSELGLEQRINQRKDYQQHQKQINIEGITQRAAEHLLHENEVSKEGVDRDWTSRFFNYAEDISDEEMQNLWAKILAGEVKQPKSFSLRTLEVLRNLSKEEAKVFSKIAKYAIKAEEDTFIFTGPSFEKVLRTGHSNDVLNQVGIQLKDIILLKELGIIYSGDFVEHSIEQVQSETKNLLFIGKKVLIITKKPQAPLQKITIALFTSVGKELLKLIEEEPNIEYIYLLAKELKDENLSFEYADVIESSLNGIEYGEAQDISV